MKRPRGRPRSGAPPKPPLNIRFAPELRSQLEQDARRANRSIREELETRSRKSYLSDVGYGGPPMAAMFREMAGVAELIGSRKGEGSFFTDLEVFLETKEIWDRIIQRHMPLPSDELIAELRRDRDDVKTGARWNRVRQAIQERLFERYPPTLAGVISASWHAAELLGESVEPISGKPAGIDEAPKAKSAAPSASPAPADTGESARSPAMGSGQGKALPLLAEVIAPLLQHHPEAFSVGDPKALPLGHLGSLARLMEDLRASGGTLSGAAQQVSQLAEVLAEAMDEAPAGDACALQCEADAGGTTARP
jgi:hypothetical protein